MYSYILTSALDGGELSTSRPVRFIPRVTYLGTQCVRGWMGPRAGLDVMEKRKSCPCRESKPGQFSLSLYRLNYQ
jgi:hypothetical protein